VPFVRVIRDKRGYETTYLLHWYREGRRQHSRILYVFRTPGGVRVGRTALEPDVLRQIERRYPDITFDWAAVRENQQVVEPSIEPRRRRVRRDESDTSVPDGPAAAVAGPEPPTPPRPAVPAAIEGATPDEQLAFLAQWYPIIRDRIPQRTTDPARAEALLALTERINPGAWTDADEITTGLQQASEALERLSHVFARRRRRSRRRTADSGAAGAPDPQPPGE
jgi:hypothetical protein